LLYKHLTKEFIRVRIGHASTAGFLDPGELRPSHASGLLTFGIPKNASAVSEWFIRTPRRRRNHQISSTFSCFGIGGVYQNPDDERGGISRLLKF
jgi:hypothetical protein